MTRGGGARPVTLAHVAERAGYSLSTASLVLRGSPLVADSTRRRVLDAAAELGYVYNRRAAGLRIQRSNTIGLLIAGLANPFWAELTEAIEEALNPTGYTLLLCNTAESTNRQEALIRTLLEYRVDGLLIVPALGSTPDLVAPVARLHVPHLVLTRRVDGLASSYVGSDDLLGGRLAAQHLIGHGCRRLAYFGGPPGIFTQGDRERGVREACEAAGVEIDLGWSRHTPTSGRGGYEAAARLLQASTPPDGVICHSDAIAFGLMRAIKDAGLTVGADVRVVGYDDVEQARAWSPSLTSVSVDARVMGHSAVGLLLDQLADPTSASQTLVLEPKLVVRESCGDEH